MRRALKLLMIGTLVHLSLSDAESWAGLDGKQSEQPVSTSSPSAEAGNPASAQSGTAMVESGVERWSKVSGIQVSPEAERVVMGQVLTSFHGEPSAHVEKAASAYLFEVRDRLRYAGQDPTKLAVPDLIISFAESTAARSYRKPRGYVSVTSEPEGASISVDRDGRGYTDTEIVLSPGRHIIKVENGHEACEKAVNVVDDRTEHVHADFTKRRRQRQCQ